MKRCKRKRDVNRNIETLKRHLSDTDHNGRDTVVGAAEEGADSKGVAREVDKAADHQDTGY